MIGQVVVLEPAEYQAWLSGGGPPGSLASNGQNLFQELAAPPAIVPIPRAAAPILPGFRQAGALEDGRTVTADENYIRESILTPGAKVVSGFKPIMPAFQGLVSEEQLNALVAYVKSLTNQSRSATERAAPTVVPSGAHP